ncbi:Uncharacterized protein PHSC3_001702 [Chlamydiales bacterium STE3]|nr:Uncharacterized protein PHSC3_001702 [Chlamydiales bacterium STE3]
MPKLAFFCILALIPLLMMATEEDDLARRIHAHLIIKDESAALAEAQKAVKNHPHSKLLRQAYIRVLAHLGYEDRAFCAFKEYSNLFPEDGLNRELLEAMAWGSIQKGAKSSSPILRIFSLIAAHHGEDAKSVQIVHSALDDPNALVRRVAVEVAATLRDAKVCDKILTMLLQEKEWNVRLGVLEAAGKMQLRQAEKHLISIVASPTTTMEEKFVASQALLHLLDKMERSELLSLSRSNRGDLRKLSAMIIGHLGSQDNLDIVGELLFDSQAEVRKNALQAMGSMQLENLEDRWVSRLADLEKDHDPEVAIYAAWIAGKMRPGEIPQLFTSWLQHDKQPLRILASAALASLGQKACSYLLTACRETQDPFVKMNLGMALIKERIALEEGLNALYKGIEENKERWMSKDFHVFKAYAPSDVKHQYLISNYPEVNNQLVRLEVLSTLAMMKHPYAKNALQSFLKERSWGITGLASAMLLTEGEEAAIEIVRDLVDDDHPKIRIQAALVLALWGGDTRAIQALKQAYPSAQREMKEQIIEGMGRIGQAECLPFLIEKMDEPFQSLRIMAASAILQCLYH